MSHISTGSCWRQCSSSGRSTLCVRWLWQHFWAIWRGGGLRPLYSILDPSWPAPPAHLLAWKCQHIPTVHASCSKHLWTHRHTWGQRHPPPQTSPQSGTSQPQQQCPSEPQPRCQWSALRTFGNMRLKVIHVTLLLCVLALYDMFTSTGQQR